MHELATKRAVTAGNLVVNDQKMSCLNVYCSIPPIHEASKACVRFMYKQSFCEPPLLPTDHSASYTTSTPSYLLSIGLRSRRSTLLLHDPLYIRHTLLQNLLQHLWVLQLLANLRDDGISQFPLLSLLDLAFVADPGFQYGLGFGG
jgi:hypothetical protein